MADITYILNDPSTPTLMIPVNLPPKPAVMDFKIDGYRGATPEMGTLEHQAACIYYSVVKGINLVNSVLQTPIQSWAATQTLYVQPRAGKQFNAFYDRQALRFFYATDPIANKMIYASESADITLHELGHAILDAMRPDLYNVQSMEIWSYHESFGDQNAIMNLLQHEEILDFMLAETNGDLRQSNVASKLAEEMGTAIFHVTGGRMGHVAGNMRNAINPFKYVIPETLPHNGLDNQLTCEPHSFSRVFTGAWYDILVAIYEKEKAAGKTPKDALKHARDILTTYTYRCLRLAPSTIRFFDAIARAMLICDKANGYAYNVEMNQVFINRGILREMVRPMVALDWMSFASQIEPSDEVIKTDEGSAMVRSKGTQILPLPFYMLTVEAPGDTAYEFEDGKCVNVTTVSGMELVEHAHQCVDFLKTKDMIRSDNQSPFELTQEGMLVRSHFACGCAASTSTCSGSVTSSIRRNCCGSFNNAITPGQPEYGKPWKKEHNSGCCGGCKTVAPCSTAPINPKGLLPGQMPYVKGPVIVGTCSGPAILPGQGNGGAAPDGGNIISYKVKENRATARSGFQSNWKI